MKRTAAVLLVLAAGACGGGDGGGEERAAGQPSMRSAALDTGNVGVSLGGFSGPEAVRHDPEQGVWFVANFGSAGDEDRDANGFISRVRDFRIDSLRFMRGTAEAPLHMPRGMFIKGDTLWVADVDGIHGFDRSSGSHLAFIDFRLLEPGFLNDIAAGPDGVLYVTDTGRSRVYRVAGAGGRPEIAAEDLPAAPNGITWDGARGAFLLAPWADGDMIRSLDLDGTVADVVRVDAGRFDGIEVTEAGLLLATQTDSSLWLVENGTPRRVVRTRGRPADIGYDAEGGFVAVPYIALDRVDFWQVP